MPSPVTTARSTANGYHPVSRTSFTNDSGSDLAEQQSAIAVSPSAAALAGGGTSGRNGRDDDGGSWEDEYGGYDGGADEETTPLQLLKREDAGEDEDEDEDEEEAEGSRGTGRRAVEDESIKTPADGGTILESFVSLGE